MCCVVSEGGEIMGFAFSAFFFLALLPRGLLYKLEFKRTHAHAWPRDVWKLFFSEHK